LLCHKCNASGLTSDVYSHSIASVVTKQTAALGLTHPTRPSHQHT
jgi:hypothetical protein